MQGSFSYISAEPIAQCLAQSWWVAARWCAAAVWRWQRVREVETADRQTAVAITLCRSIPSLCKSSGAHDTENPVQEPCKASCVTSRWHAAGQDRGSSGGPKLVTDGRRYVHGTDLAPRADACAGGRGTSSHRLHLVSLLLFLPPMLNYCLL